MSTQTPNAAALLDTYAVPERTFDEFTALSNAPTPFARKVLNALGHVDLDVLARRQRTADMVFAQGGVTFSVYSDARGVEKVFPFDLVPRPIAASEWERVERGLKQRVQALNLFLADIYGPQRIISDRVIAAETIERCTGYTPSVRGIVPRGGVYVHIAGIDLVRDSAGTFRVLEDNLRCPSGVSYVIENRAVMKRMFPNAFAKLNIRPVETYPMQLREAMRSLSTSSDESAAILTPGPFNSAYFEHGFLARSTGIPLVHNTDLVVHDDHVYVRTTRGLQPIDVIYRRTDDDFLDPEWFRPDSMLGVPGLMRAYARGNVALMNAVGNGVADDKSIYPHVPDIVRYYLGEDALIEQVETYRCSEPAALDHVLANLERLVVKRVDGAGGYGMLVGPTSTQAEREMFALVLRAEPASYVAQPLVELSTCPVFADDCMGARRVDLRPYIITGAGEPWVLPGGLTRVALKEGSYVVNSSQGGGSKDTWIVEDRS